jgi:putative protease
VTAIWRRLLDEGRGATDAEMRELAAIFSRGGFTDGYFTGKIGHHMLGVRSEKDKEQSREQQPFTEITRRLPLSMRCVMRADEPVALTVTCGEKTATVLGDMPQIARTSPMDEAAVKKCLGKLGGTPYALADLTVSLQEGLMMPVSRLNALRREALAALQPENRLAGITPAPYTPVHPAGERSKRPTARFEHAAQIPSAARNFFEHIYLPLDRFAPPADGVVLPPVIFDSEVENVRKMLKNATRLGANGENLALADSAPTDNPHADAPAAGESERNTPADDPAAGDPPSAP